MKEKLFLSGLLILASLFAASLPQASDDVQDSATAIGVNALVSNTTGDFNMASGNFALFNNTSYCPGGTCANENQPMFTLYLGPYTTKAYRAAQFE